MTAAELDDATRRARTLAILFRAAALTLLLQIHVLHAEAGGFQILFQGRGAEVMVEQP